MTNIIKIAAVVIVVLVILAVWVYYGVKHKVDPMRIAELIRDRPQDASIYYVRNDTVLASVNADRVMPLASTVKIMLAITYARQAASGIINPAEMVDTSSINKYYLPKTDGNAHPKWLADMAKKGCIVNGSVSLEEVAKGMIRFSSNANTEYLMEKLGLDAINANIAALGLTKHEYIYPSATAAMMLCMATDVNTLRAMPLQEYIDSSIAIHHRLAAGTLTTATAKTGAFNLEKQKIWSDRLTGGTTREYVSILKKINCRTYFDSGTQHHLEILMEGIMENPMNQQWLLHAGAKGGSTAFVLTSAIYATTTKGETTELAYFLNNLSYADVKSLQLCMNKFHLYLLTNPQKRNDYLTIINSGKK